MNKIYIGCDPGKQGGIVALNSNGDVIKKEVVPLIGKDVNLHELYKKFIDIKEIAEKESLKLHVCMEDVHSIHMSSAKSNFTFGYMVGCLETIIVAHNLSYTKVAPKKWQENIWLSSEIERESSTTDAKGKVKLGKIKTKVVSLKSAIRLFPNVDFRATERSRTPHDGLIDSALIAEYCRRMNF